MLELPKNRHLYAVFPEKNASFIATPVLTFSGHNQLIHQELQGCCLSVVQLL